MPASISISIYTYQYIYSQHSSHTHTRVDRVLQDGPVMSFPTLTESSCNHYSRSRRLISLCLTACPVGGPSNHPSTRAPTPTHTRSAGLIPNRARQEDLSFFFSTATDTSTGHSQGSRAPSSVARFLTPTCMPTHSLCNLYCYGSVGSSGTQSTIGSQTVKAAISLSPAMEHWFSKGVMCVQQHAVSPHSRPGLAYNHHGHYTSPTSGRPPYAHATTHVQSSCGRPSMDRVAPCQTRRPRLFGATLAFARPFQIDRSRLSTTHGQALPLPTFTSQGLGSENKSTGAKKQFLMSQLPKPRRVLLAATRPAP